MKRRSHRRVPGTTWIRKESHSPVSVCVWVVLPDKKLLLLYEDGTYQIMDDVNFVLGGKSMERFDPPKRDRKKKRVVV